MLDKTPTGHQMTIFETALESFTEQTSEKEVVFFCLTASQLEKKAGESNNRLQENLWAAIPHSRDC